MAREDNRTDFLTDGTCAVQSVEESEFYADPLAKYKRDGDWKAGVRPDNVIETLRDIAWITDPDHPERREGERPRLVCGFCGEDRAIRNYREGERWYRTHACEGEGVPIEQWLAA